MTNLRYHLIDVLDWFRFRSIPIAALIAPSIVGLALGVALWRAVDRPLLDQADPTPARAPIVMIASPTPAPLATAEPPIQVAAALPRFVVCYDQPINGSVLGPIPAPDASAVVARYGSAWVMTPWNGGYCWLRAADVGLPDVADLAPAPRPQVVYVAAQPVQAAPTYDPTYLTANDPVPPSDWYTDIPTPNPVVVRELIGDDPDALACGGSPICGGLTNAEAAAALAERP